LIGYKPGLPYAQESTTPTDSLTQATSLKSSTHVTFNSSVSLCTDHTMSTLSVLLILLTSCLVLYTGWDWGSRGGRSSSQSPKRPNIVFILTDDQDLHMNSLEYMPHTRKLIADQGTTFSNHFCTNALCCPSRVTIWTGLSPHNTNVTDVNPPHGM